MTKICLKTHNKKKTRTPVTLTLSARLPEHIMAPCIVLCDYDITEQVDYFTLKLWVKGDLSIACQRCLEPYYYTYENATELFVCRDDKVAERLMDQHECIVVPGYLVDLHEIVTDELHLYARDRHPNKEDCSYNFSK